MTADLHTHTSHSDGTQTPAELVAQAADAGLETIGLTDHDTVAGWDEAERAVRAHGLGLLRGMEVSCRYEGISVHMLAYLHAPEDNELMSEVAKARRARETRSAKIVELLAQDFPLTWDDVERQRLPGATVGRPHIADALVALGLVRDRGEAFATLLSSTSPYYVPIPVMDAVHAVGLIHDAGGAAIFAHPSAQSRGRVVPDRGMAELIAAGLDGLEVDHRDNPLTAREQLRRTASDHDLIVTGSSDFHGAGKPNRLGENTTDAQMLDRIVQAGRGVGFIPPAGG